MSKPIDKLKTLYDEYSRFKWPNVPDHARTYPSCFSKSTTTNGLTACVIKYIELLGWGAERTGNEGRVIDNTKVVTDTVGMKRTIGSVDRIKSSGKKGTSDIKAVIQGRFVAIEIKNAKTKDRISKAQAQYANQVVKSGGIYKVITTLEEAIEWLDHFGENPFKHEFWK
jgi:hypothetical protein